MPRTYLYVTGETSSSDMKGITLEKIIAFLRLGLKFACCWPIPRSATNCQILSDKLFRLLSGLHAMLLVAELAYTIIYHVENVRIFMQSTCAMGIMFEVPLQILLFTLQHDRLQVSHRVESYPLSWKYFFIIVTLIVITLVITISLHASNCRELPREAHPRVPYLIEI